jgi:hypothetical protein
MFIWANSGHCLWGATITYLGYLGGTSPANARAVFPLREQAEKTIPRQTKRVLEAFQRMLDRSDSDMRTQIAGYVEGFVHDERSGVRTVARRVQKRLAMS